MTTSQKRAIGYAIRARNEEYRSDLIAAMGMTDAFKRQNRYKTRRGFIDAIMSGRIVIHPETGLAVTPRRYKPI